MQNFQMTLSSLQQVQDFVAIAVKQPFDIRVGNEWQKINGKDFMGMFSLDYTHPVTVSMNCSTEQLEQFRAQIAQYLV